MNSKGETKGETKGGTNGNNPRPEIPSDAVVHTSLLTPVNDDFNLDWLISIFAYVGPTEKETVSFRCFNKLFSKALKPLPCWTSFPHPKYSTLNKLFCRFDRLSRSDFWTTYQYGNKYGRNNLLLTNIPEVLLIENATHDEKGEVVHINMPISIVGESREHCTIIGGLKMCPPKGLLGHKKDDMVFIATRTRPSRQK